MDTRYPSAPSIKEAECDICKGPVEDYTPKFMKDVALYADKVQECKLFMDNYYSKNKKFVIDRCMDCAFKRWRELSLARKRPSQEKSSKSKQYFKFMSARWKLVALSAIMCLIGYLFSFIWMFFNGDIDSRPVINEDKLNVTMTRLKNHFPALQPSLMKKMNGGFKRLKKPGEPFVLLLLHDDSNKMTTDCLASYTSIVAKQNIFTNTAKSVLMDASEWTTHSADADKDSLYGKLDSELRKHEVLVLENLQDLPWPLAEPFHFLCDTINPQIEKAMYILELKVNGSLQLTTGDAAEHDKLVAAERAMEMAWLDAPDELRTPLVARLTSYVDAVLLKPEEGCSNESRTWPDNYFHRISP